MATFSLVTLRLARFDGPVTLPELEVDDATSSLRLLGSDDMASGQRIGGRTSAVWALLELHRTRDAAMNAGRVADGRSMLFDGAIEAWSAVLQPYSHRGRTNWAPHPLFEPGTRRSHDGPFVVLSTIGFDPEHLSDLTRIRDFIRGAATVRSSFAGTPGLRFEHMLWFGMTATDPCTLTMWDDDDALRPPVYRPGEHRTLVDDLHRNRTADRTSFTRFRVLDSAGTWNGERLPG